MPVTEKTAILLIRFEVERRTDNWAARCLDFGFVVYANSPAALRKEAIKAANAYLGELVKLGKVMPYLKKHRVQHVIIEPGRLRSVFTIDPPSRANTFNSVLNLPLSSLVPA